MKNYKLTFFGACLCFFLQALVINIYPFFFTAFNNLYDISLQKLTYLTFIIFAVQFSIDAFGYKLADKLGYRKSLFLCNASIFLAFTSICILINLINPFIAIIISIVLSSFGGGIIETISSPMVEALPFENKSAKMSLLHSFYCWGHLFTILFSTLLRLIIPTEKWYLCLLIWAFLPILNTLVFIKAPIKELQATEELCSSKSLFKQKTYIFMLFALLFAGAIEQGLAQWISYFAENTLKMDKTKGDLTATCIFALCMALSRTFYGVKGGKLNLGRTLIICSLCAFAGLICIALEIKWLSVVGIVLAGLAIGILWPGILSFTTSSGVNGGTKMFSFFALAGDAGCLLGPMLIGFIASSSSFKVGISVNSLSGLFIAMLVLLAIKNSMKNKKNTLN